MSSRLVSPASAMSRRDYTDTFTAIYNTSTPPTGTAIITPATGKSIRVKSVYVNTQQGSGTAEFRFATSNNLIARFYFASTSSQFSIPDMLIEGANNESVTMILTGVSSDVAVHINYKELD